VLAEVFTPLASIFATGRGFSRAEAVALDKILALIRHAVLHRAAEPTAFALS
jgi:hypothetical protein